MIPFELVEFSVPFLFIIGGFIAGYSLANLIHTLKGLK